MSGAAVYTLTSPLHDRESVETVSSSFLASLERLAGCRLEVKGPDFSGYGSSPLSLVYVRTGGTEGIFMDLYSRYGELFRSSPVRLLASGESNSLAAAMEILSFLRQQGCSSPGICSLKARCTFTVHSGGQLKSTDCPDSL